MLGAGDVGVVSARRSLGRLPAGVNLGVAAPPDRSAQLQRIDQVARVEPSGHIAYFPVAKTLALLG